jgi:hypothetical protein
VHNFTVTNMNGSYMFRLQSSHHQSVHIRSTQSNYISVVYMRWAEHVARAREGRGVYRGLFGNPERMRLLGRPICRWEDNIKMDIQEVGCGVMDWIGLAQERGRWRALVNVVMNLWVT